MTDFVLVAVVMSLVAVLKWPWLVTVGLVAVMRLGTVNDRYIDAAVDEAVELWAMPDQLGQWLRPRPRRGRGGRMSAG